MKKTALYLLVTLLTVSMLSVSVLGVNSDELSEYGQTTVAARYLATAPVLDGQISEGEYGDPIHTLTYDPNDPSQYWSGYEETDSFKLTDVLPEEAILYMGYDAEHLYIATVVKDEDHYCPNDGLEVWDGDYLEIDLSFNMDGTVDSMLDRCRIAYGISSESGKPFAYAAKVPEYAAYTVNAELSDYSIYRENLDGITVYELALSWKDLTGKEEAPEKGFFMFQYGVAHSEYAELSEYNAYLGVWRYSTLVPAGVVADTAKMALHIFTIDTSVLPVESETSAEDSVSEPESSSAETTEEPQTSDSEEESSSESALSTEVTSDEAEITTGASEEKDNGISTGVVIGIVAAAVVIIAVVIVLVRKKKK